MPLLLETITRPVGRIGAAAQNALEVARFGGLNTDEEPSPYEVAAEHRVYRLRHYYSEAQGGDADGRAPENERDAAPPDNVQTVGPPVLLVPPMMLAAEVYDVSPRASGVTLLHEHGADPWVVDFGAPEKVEGGLERTLADH